MLYINSLAVIVLLRYNELHVDSNHSLSTRRRRRVSLPLDHVVFWSIIRALVICHQSIVIIVNFVKCFCFLNINCKGFFVKNVNTLSVSVSFLFPRPYFDKLTCEMSISSVLMVIIGPSGQGLLEYKPWGLKYIKWWEWQ